MVSRLSERIPGLLLMIYYFHKVPISENGQKWRSEKLNFDEHSRTNCRKFRPPDFPPWSRGVKIRNLDQELWQTIFLCIFFYIPSLLSADAGNYGIIKKHRTYTWRLRLPGFVEVPWGLLPLPQAREALEALLPLTQMQGRKASVWLGGWLWRLREWFWRLEVDFRSQDCGFGNQEGGFGSQEGG